MMIACEFLTSTKNARYFFMLGMAFNDRTISSCSFVRSDFSRTCDVKGGSALAVPFTMSVVLRRLFAAAALLCSSWDTGVFTPISATSCAMSSMAFPMWFSRLEKTWVKRCWYDSEPSIFLIRARESFEDLKER